METNSKCYYKMVLTYVDDILCVSHKAKETLIKVIKERFTIKNDAIESPEMFLGAQIALQNILGQECWTMTSSKYINAAIKRVEETAQKQDRRINGHGDTPLPSNYRPETDMSDELGAEMMR